KRRQCGSGPFVHVRDIEDQSGGSPFRIPMLQEGLGEGVTTGSPDRGPRCDDTLFKRPRTVKTFDRERKESLQKIGQQSSSQKGRQKIMSEVVQRSRFKEPRLGLLDDLAFLIRLVFRKFLAERRE